MTANADTKPSNGDPETVTAKPLPTWQTNGTVWSLEEVNGVTYVGGAFTAVRPPGAAPGEDEVERHHLAAFDTSSGELLDWAPEVRSPATTFSDTPDVNCNDLGGGEYECATVWTVRSSPDKQKLFVGGDFQSVNGHSRQAVAAFDIATGELDRTFKPGVAGRVYTIAPTNEVAYMGGNFESLQDGTTRTRFAAFDHTTNTLLPWSPTADQQVRSMSLTSDESRVVVGGKFDQLNGIDRHGVGAILTDEAGQNAPWAGDQMVSVANLTSLTMKDDVVYLSGDARGSLSEGLQAVDPYTGESLWQDACRGASHSSAVVRGVVYVGSHSHDCGGAEDGFGENYQGYPSGDRNRYKLRAVVPGEEEGRAKLLHWFPHTDDGDGPRAMATDDDTLWIGGEFTLINKTDNQQGLVRFSFLDQGAESLAPIRPSEVYAHAVGPEQVNVTWEATPDRDNRELEYWLIRNDDVDNPIHKVTTEGRPWLQPWMSYVDTDVEPGQTYRYSVRAWDPEGVKSVRSYPAEATPPQEAVSPVDLAAADGAKLNYQFEEAQGSSTASSSVGSRSATVGSNVTLGQTGVFGSAASFDGSSGGAVVDTSKSYALRQNSVETMFKTSSTQGGALLSVGNTSSTTGVSTNLYDRNLLYMTDDGRLAWGFTPNNFNFPDSTYRTRKAVTTTDSFNDGEWHHVAATFEPGTGARIYVDGNLVVDDPTLNWSRTVSSYFRIGGDNLGSWPNQPSSYWWQGDMDHVASYDYPLSERQVVEHANAMLGRPSSPAGFQAEATSDTTADLSWTAVGTATAYNVYRDGTEIATVTDPTFSDSALTPATSYDYFVRAENDKGESTSTKTVSVTTDTPAPVGLVASGDSWKYETSGAESTDWDQPGFDDSTWAAGISELGHYDGDEATEITPFADDGTTRRITTYFRTTFDVDSAATIAELGMRVKRDDGVVVYLNGKEIWRDNMPTGPIGENTKASTWAPDDGTTWQNSDIATTDLVDGQNTIAVEVHQSSASSKDLSFNLELEGKPSAEAGLSEPAAPTGPVAVVTGETSVDLSWNEVAGATSYSVYRDGTKVSTDPATSFSDTGLSPGQDVTYTVTASNDNGESAQSADVSVTTDTPAPVGLVASGDSWKYETSGAESTDWDQPGFDDSTWAAGISELGHYDGDEATEITPFADDGTTRRITTYFRTTFDVDSAATIAELGMRVKRDDGVVVYLNGKEIWRDNMPTGPIGENTKASTWAPDDGTTWQNSDIATTDLVDGQNTIAVEVHQSSASSKDLSFNLELEGKPSAEAGLSEPAAPTGPVAVVTGETSVDLSWNEVAGATSYSVYRDGTKVSTDPATSFSDTGLSPGQDVTYTVTASNDNGESAQSADVSVTTDTPAPVGLVASGDSWKYETSGAESTDWDQPGFDDSTWAAGISELGHYDGDEATEITPFADDGTTRRITTYFRTTFDVDSAAAIAELGMRVKRDDGVVVYLNGKEIWRDNMPTGPIGENTKASTWAPDDGTTWQNSDIATTDLVDGQNTIAVEVHQSSASSKDLSFNLELEGKPSAEAGLSEPAAPTGPVAVVTGETSVDLSWNEVAGATSYSVYRDGTKVSTDPATSFSDTGLSPGQDVTYTVTASNDNGESAQSAGVSVTTDTPAPVGLVASGDSWKYETSGAESTDWDQPGFDDSTWAAGISELGHYDGDEATEITPFADDGTTRRITTYFRTTFDVDPAATIAELGMRVKRDDGVVVYLNGKEVWRDNMPTGPIGENTAATTWAPDDGTTWQNSDIATTDLVDGQNTIAVEVHQSSASSKDLSFNLELEGLFG